MSNPFAMKLRETTRNVMQGFHYEYGVQAS
jgi:hypothetical protein